MKDTGKVMSFVAFLVLIVSGILWIVNFILSFFETALKVGVLNNIASILLIIVVVWVAWQYAKEQSKVMKIIFLVLATIAVLAALGVLARSF